MVFAKTLHDRDLDKIKGEFKKMKWRLNPLQVSGWPSFLILERCAPFLILSVAPFWLGS